MQPLMFIGVGAGRCGTMMLANLLNSESGTLCLHEGQIRDRETKGEQVLPFLTLQNNLAYQKPEQAEALLRAHRGDMAATGKARGVSRFGDISYNYAPFVRHLHSVLPDIKLIYIFRSGIDFVQSAVALEGIDPTPLGWPPRRKPLDPAEAFVGLGRLQPPEGSHLEIEWEHRFDHFERNAWLWAETNRLILDGMNSIPPSNRLSCRFEDMFCDLEAGYSQIRQFLAIDGEVPVQTQELLSGQPINQRMRPASLAVERWTPQMKRSFNRLAGDMMDALGYGQL